MNTTLIKSFLISLLALTLCSCREKIVHNLSENEANKLLAQLYSVNIDASKEQQADSRWSINVPNSDTSFVMNYLNETHLIKEENQSSLNSASLLSGREEQKFKYERALSSEIEYTLANIDNVLQARVHLNLPAKDPFLGKTINKNEIGSASVLLVVKDDFKEDSEQIKNLVAGASGLKAETISVLFNKKKITTALTKEKINTPVKSSTANFFQEEAFQIILSLLILVGAFAFFMRKKKNNKKATFKDIAKKIEAQKQEIPMEA